MFSNLKEYIKETKSIYLTNFNLPNSSRLGCNYILEKIPQVNISDILIMGVFGFAIRPPIVNTINKKFLLWYWTKYKIIKTANDVDCLIIVKDNKHNHTLTTDLKIEYEEQSNYGWYWFNFEKKAALHIVVTSLNKLRKALKKNDRRAIDIVNECKLLMGYPHILDNLKKLAQKVNNKRPK